MSSEKLERRRIRLPWSLKENQTTEITRRVPLSWTAYGKLGRILKDIDILGNGMVYAWSQPAGLDTQHRNKKAGEGKGYHRASGRTKMAIGWARGNARP